MTKRALAALLWFGVVWFGYEILWSVAEVPRMVGPILGASVATLVSLNPTGQFWTWRSRGQESARQLPAAGRSLG